MEIIISSSNFIKVVFTMIFIYFTYIKIMNYKRSDLDTIIFIISCSIIEASTYIILTRFFNPLIVLLLLYFTYSLVIKYIIKKDNLEHSIIAYIIACILSYSIYLMSIIISGVIMILVSTEKQYTDPISLVTIPVIASLLFYCIFRIRRFNNGFNFLKNRKVNKKMKFSTMLFTGIVMLIFGISQKMRHWITGIFLIIGSGLIVFSLLVWIKSQITKTYKSRMRDRTIEIQKTELDEQAKVIEEVKAENIKLASAIHKYNKKFSSLEFAMKKALELENKTEFANEISTILEDYQESAKNFAKEVEVNKTKLPETKIVGIDNMFKYMQEEANNKNINFDLKLNTSINSLLETIISKDKFETLIGDHLKDAIIAVDASKNSYKSILVTLGLVEGVYDLSIYDTGIEFEIETLLKLGKEQITTYKDKGGSGIGFMTTFETLKECKASLVIEEYNPETTNYTKAVIIRFDGKNKYKICSYRAEKIKEQNQGRKIAIEKLK